MVKLRRALLISLFLPFLLPLTECQAEAGIWEKIFSGKQGESNKLADDTEIAHENPLIRWMRMTPSQRQKLREKYRMFKGLSPVAQQELRRRSLFFESLAPEQQGILEKKYMFLKSLDPIKRAQIYRLHILWQKMPNAQKQHIILQVERIRNLPVIERDRELSRSVIWQVFSPRERTSLGSFMKNLRSQIFPFVVPESQQEQETDEIYQEKENQEIP